jgi:hypothetical protein
VGGHLGQQGRGADGQPSFFIEADRGQTGDPFQADDAFGKKHAVANPDQQVGAAGHDPGIPAALCEDGNRFIHGRRGDIVESGYWHGRYLLALV